MGQGRGRSLLDARRTCGARGQHVEPFIAIHDMKESKLWKILMRKARWSEDEKQKMAEGGPARPLVPVHTEAGSSCGGSELAEAESSCLWAKLVPSGEVNTLKPRVVAVEVNSLKPWAMLVLSVEVNTLKPRAVVG